MTKDMVCAGLGLSVLVALFIASHPVQAGECSGKEIMARGEEASYVWLAKIKARALWRRKVRSLPGLGPDYANWAHAQNTEERCLSGGAGTVCIFTGIPCLP
jgi:hypothetical protein